MSLSPEKTNIPSAERSASLSGSLFSANERDDPTQRSLSGFSVNERDEENERSRSLHISQEASRINFLASQRPGEGTVVPAEGTMQTAFHLTGKESSQAETVKFVGGGMKVPASGEEGGKLFENRVEEDTRQLTGTGKYDLE